MVLVLQYINKNRNCRVVVQLFSTSASMQASNKKYDIWFLSQTETVIFPIPKRGGKREASFKPNYFCFDWNLESGCTFQPLQFRSNNRNIIRFGWWILAQDSPQFSIITQQAADGKVICPMSTLKLNFRCAVTIYYEPQHFTKATYDCTHLYDMYRSTDLVLPRENQTNYCVEVKVVHVEAFYSRVMKTWIYNKLQDDVDYPTLYNGHQPMKSCFLKYIISYMNYMYFDEKGNVFLILFCAYYFILFFLILS